MARRRQCLSWHPRAHAAHCGTIECMAVFNPFLPSFQTDPVSPLRRAARQRAGALQRGAPGLGADRLRGLRAGAARRRDVLLELGHRLGTTGDGAAAAAPRVPAGRDADRAQLRPARAHSPPHAAQPRVHPPRYRGPAPAHRGDRRLAAGRRGRLAGSFRCRRRLRAAASDHRNRGAAGRPAGGPRPLQALVSRDRAHDERAQSARRHRGRPRGHHRADRLHGRGSSRSAAARPAPTS